MGSSKICTAYSQHYKGWPVNSGMDKYSQKWRIPPFIYIVMLQKSFLFMSHVSSNSTVPYSESTVPRKDNNWRTLVINANSIANKKAEIAAIAEYCDPDLMLISETKLGPDILNGEFVPEGYMGKFRKDRKRGAGGGHDHY